jgi:hypothetical protein
MPCGLRQAIKISRKALLQGAWRFGNGAHPDRLSALPDSNDKILDRRIKFVTQ